MTEPKPTSQVILATETGAPLLALGRFGLGMGLAYTSDLTEKWGSEWLAWDTCGKFWAQTLRAIVRKSETRGLLIDDAIVDDTWVITVTRRYPNHMPVSKVTWDAHCLDEHGQSIPVQFRETGLGRYETNIPLANHCKLTLRFQDQTS
ncbi:MAG: Ca-activated chloride channel family protein [Verrucomicrobiales bacterium]|jgi:Ca-activated chloride channel family protein